MSYKVKIDSYTIMDQDGNPLASNLTMDQIALSEEMDIVFQIQLTDGEPILHPKKIDV